jgi:hypothetical protein
LYTRGNPSIKNRNLLAEHSEIYRINIEYIDEALALSNLLRQCAVEGEGSNQRAESKEDPKRGHSAP